MGTVENLKKERESVNVLYAQFLIDYKKKEKLCFGFVEGKDDPSYYRNILNAIKRECKVVFYSSGGKKKVKEMYDKISSNGNNPNDRIVYFMDRDLSDLINDPNLINDSHVYITDNYSIENDILNSDTLGAVMQDLLGFSSNSWEDIDKIKCLYDEQLSHFENEMLPIMANIVIWKRNNIESYYNNLKIRELFEVKDGKLLTIKDDDDRIKILYNISKVDYSNYDKNNTDNVVAEINLNSSAHKILRGKYLLTFFIMFCNSVFVEWENIGINKPTKGCKLNEQDFMKSIAPRARIPESLRDFFQKTIVQYFENITP